MHKTFNKLFLCLLMVITLYSCKDNKNITNKEFLYLLAQEAGLDRGKDNYLTSLNSWGITKGENLLEPIDYEQAGAYLCRLMRLKSDDVKTARINGLLPKNSRIIDKNIAKEWILAALKRLDTDPQKVSKFFNKDLKNKENAKINDYYFENGNFYIVKKNGNRQQVKAPIYTDVELKSSEILKIDPKKITFFGKKLEETGYNKPRFAPLNNKYLINGYTLTYHLLPSGIKIHLSKNKKIYNLFADLTLNNIKPQFIWHFNRGNLEQVKATLNFDIKQEIGISRARIIDQKRPLNSLSKQGFLQLLAIKERQPKEEIIPLCRFKLPLQQLPFVDLDIELALHLYAGGKVKLIYTSQQTLGFEIYKGNFRTIKKINNNVYPSFLASAKASIGLKSNFSFLKNKLANIYLMSGAQVSLNPQVHFFDDREELTLKIDDDFNSLSQRFKNHYNVQLCADLALDFFMKLGINDEDTFLGKISFNRELPLIKKKIILNGANFLEKGMLVKACHFNKPITNYKTPALNGGEQIRLAKYSIFIKKNEYLDIPIISLPKGYQLGDCLFTSLDDNIVCIKDKQVVGISSGATQVKIATKDQKHEIYFVVLVSDAG